MSYPTKLAYSIRVGFLAGYPAMGVSGVTYLYLHPETALTATTEMGDFK